VFTLVLLFFAVRASTSTGTCVLNLLLRSFCCVYNLTDLDEAVKEKIRVNAMKRNKPKLTPEWDAFLKSEWKQLNRYEKVSMFGDPVKADLWMTILPWVWSYVNKEDPLIGDTIRKSRGTCNGGPQYGAAITLAEMYATCVEQPFHRLTWAMSAAMNLICKGYDVGNTTNISILYEVWCAVSTMVGGASWKRSYT
jgi:hypothetical protein